MAYKQMIAPCGVDCASCVHYLANENPAALVQVEKWSALLNIPIEIIKGLQGSYRANTASKAFVWRQSYLLYIWLRTRKENRILWTLRTIPLR